MSEEMILKKLRDELDLFTNEKQNEFILDYQNLLKEKTASGLSLEEAVKMVGTPESYAKKILNQYGLKGKRNKGFFYRKFEELFEVIHHVVDTMAKNSWQENLKIIFDLFILIVFIALLKIPFIAIENIGDGLFEVLNSPTVLTIWSFVIDVVYLIVALMAFMNIFTRWFKNLNSKKKKEMEGKELDAITLNKED